MTHFAFVCPPLQGHLNPMFALANELQMRGHQSTFIMQEDVRGLVEKAGLNLHAVGLASHPPGDLEQDVARITRVKGLWGIGAIVRDMARTTDMLARELPDAIEALGIEVMICDQLEAAGGLVAQHVALAHVSIANALLINRDDSVPPFFAHWLPDKTEWARRRNKGATDVSDWMMGPHAKVVARYADMWGLGPRRTCADCLSPLLDLAQVVPGFDFPRQDVPDSLRYVGPIRSPQADVELPFEHDPARPLVYASLGTLFGGRFDIFRAIAGACADLDVTLLIAHGGRLSTDQIAKLPGRPIVMPFVPQRAVLPRASLLITHAGMNTVMDSLSFGVPAIAIPLAYDQPSIAARLEWSGAGERMMPGRVSARKLRAAIERVIAGQTYRERAGAIAREISTAGGLVRAADLIETACFPRLGSS